MRIVDAALLSRFDRWAIERIGLPELLLMENAALAVAGAISHHHGDRVSVGILCGPGNNGGDGLAILRQLHTRGHAALAVLAVPRSHLRGSARVQLEVCERLGLPVLDGDPAVALPARELWVDALFGTGLSRPLEGDMALWVERLAEQDAPIVAVDLPSGLDADRARPLGPHVRADMTVTFAAAKAAHVLAPASEAVGRLVIADLGLPWRDFLAQTDLEGERDGDDPAGERPSALLEVVEREDLQSLLGRRRLDSHKGDFGHLVVVAGSTGMSGAARLAATAALRSGVGLLSLAVPGRIRAECAIGVPEAMTLSLGDVDRLGAADLELLDPLLERCHAVALGPGLGADDRTFEAVRRLVAGLELPLVLDADGINAFADRAEALQGRRAATVLTPHPGELARLLGISAAEVLEDRLGAVRRAAALTGCQVVLKGHQTLIAAPKGRAFINPTGNPGMASGGCGDVLTGVIGALLARGLGPIGAAVAGVYVHGRAGDLAALEQGWSGLVAGDVAAALPRGFRELEGEPTEPTTRGD